jgi:hypothetical protein
MPFSIIAIRSRTSSSRTRARVIIETTASNAHEAIATMGIRNMMTSLPIQD